MVVLKEKVFKAVDILQGEDLQNEFRLEEGDQVRITLEEGEIVDATIIKIMAKELTFHVEHEIGNRVLVWADFYKFQNLEEALAEEE